eukprot:CAMPEP_0201867358 /NCGR_PEP_ID=MMETSP0902-20130614/1611_1 /ASSEMBLY_ACC=CAM_ASM_000551 /TAXON_ID=420261 /ORGANISM="Thalassiosira antarctica, Strain CCMP982" /LENGTH=85 /DNA_ID=CAMNT_0048392501 /DNA_START=415 /DNA_END=669 /DNA_ORIENTATION=+
MNLRHLPQTHANHTLVPSFNDLAQSHGKGKGFLAGVFGGPELGGEVLVLAVAGAVDGDGLAAAGEGAVAGAEDGFRESHDAMVAW